MLREPSRRLSNMRLRRLLLPLLVAALVGAASAAAATKKPASHPLTTAITGAPEIYGNDSALAFSRLRDAAIRTVITQISWPTVAPQQEPAGWSPTSPDDPNYDWTGADAQIRAVAAAGFQPVVQVLSAPTWARAVPEFPESPPVTAKFGQFMRAIAQRYGGGRPGLPRVRYWQVWNEPNISLFLRPQYDPKTKKFTSPDVYRGMVNAAAKSIHAVHADNVVVAGETAPFRDIYVQDVDRDWGPLKFMRRLLCVDDRGRPTCKKPVEFDVWSTHPYTSGGPLHHAVLPYDVSLGDLPKMRATLNAAARAKHIRSKRPVRFWVSEFSWDSSPPDLCAPPMSLLERWVPEAMYRMWANGVDLVGWFQLMDEPMTTSYFQSGLYFLAQPFAAAKPKGWVQGLRFPFVALRRGKGVYVWAHTPFGARGRVVVQQSFNGGWSQVKVLQADRYGIVQAVLKATPVGEFRALLPTGELSLPFSMTVPPDQRFNPFGQASLLEPDGQNC